MPYKNILAGVAIAVAAIVAFAAINFYLYTHPKKYSEKVTPADFSMDYENISFETSDGLTIKGWYIPAAKKTDRAIIMAHGFPFDKTNIVPLAGFLHEDFNLMLFDFRYFGESGGSYTSLGYHEAKDLVAAADFARQKGNKKLGAWGFSMGGSVAIMAAKEAQIDAIVADSPYKDMNTAIDEVFGAVFWVFGKPFAMATKLMARILITNPANVSPLNSIRDVDAPVLLIHGKNDEVFKAKDAGELKDAAKNAELWLVNASHGYTYAQDPEAYNRKVLEFFRKNLS